MKAYMICDMNNPVSTHYLELSLSQFSIIDSLDIEPYQCFTPETLPEFEFDETRQRTPSEKATIYTHYSLWKKAIETGEDFWIMEHDAYLRPDRIDSFWDAIQKYEDPKFNICSITLGIGAEMYKGTKQWFGAISDLFENERKSGGVVKFPRRGRVVMKGGPLGYMSCGNQVLYQTSKKRPSLAMHNVCVRKDSVAVDNYCVLSAPPGIKDVRIARMPPNYKHYWYTPMPVTQMISRKLGNTIDKRMLWNETPEEKERRDKLSPLPNIGRYMETHGNFKWID